METIRFCRIDDVDLGDSHLLFEGTACGPVHYLRVDQTFEITQGDGTLLISGDYPFRLRGAGGGSTIRKGLRASTRWGEFTARRPKYGLRASRRSLLIEGATELQLTKRYFGRSELLKDGEVVASMNWRGLRVKDPANTLLIAVALWCFVTDMNAVIGSPFSRLLAMCDMTYGGLG